MAREDGAVGDEGVDARGRDVGAHVAQVAVAQVVLPSEPAGVGVQQMGWGETGRLGAHTARMKRMWGLTAWDSAT